MGVFLDSFEFAKIHIFFELTKYFFFRKLILVKNGSARPNLELEVEGG